MTSVECLSHYPYRLPRSPCWNPAVTAIGSIDYATRVISVGRRKKKRTPKLSTQQLTTHAEALLSAGRFREAVDAYKRLLKDDPRDEWRERLGEAYFGRAGELAGKGMYREAAALWENMESLCGLSRGMETYLSWLLAAGRIEKAARVFGSHVAEMDPRVLEGISSRFAALLLAEVPEVAGTLTETLPAEHPLIRDLSAAREALGAWCRGDDATMEAQLKAIVFRSPYRDLRQLLKGLAVASVDPSRAMELLDCVPPASGFSGLVATVRAAIHPGPGVYQMLPSMSPDEQTLTAALRGLDEQQLSCLRPLAGIAAGEHSKALFDFLIGHQACVGEEYAARTALALLPAYPGGMRSYERHFGPLPEQERARIQALAAERHADDYLDTEQSWRRYADLLKMDPDNESNRLKAALVLRHIVEIAEKELPLTADEEELTRYLEESVELDPGHKPTYLKLIGLYKSASDARSRKAYIDWVERAVEGFPTDSDVLQTAVDAAIGKRAFKKAIRLARRILDLDPINTRARGLLLSSHLAHARKLVRSGKHSLARKELEPAAALERKCAKTGVVAIIRGILETLAGHETAGKALIEEGAKETGAGFAGRLRVRVEAGRLGLDELLWRRLVSIVPAPAHPSAQDVLRFASVIGTYENEGVKDLREAVEEFARPLSELAGLIYSQEEMEAVCACFHRIGNHELLEEYASRALTRWKEYPAFVFYRIHGRAKGDPRSVAEGDQGRLVEASERAEAAGARQVAQMIDAFLHRVDDLFGLPGGPLPAPPLGLAQAMEELLEEMGPGGIMDLLEAMAERGFDDEPPFELPAPSRRSKAKPQSPRSKSPSGEGDAPIQGKLF